MKTNNRIIPFELMRITIGVKITVMLEMESRKVRILIRRFPVLKIDAQNIKDYEANCQKYDYRKKRT